MKLQTTNEEKIQTFGFAFMLVRYYQPDSIAMDMPDLGLDSRVSSSDSKYLSEEREVCCGRLGCCKGSTENACLGNR